MKCPKCGRDMTEYDDRYVCQDCPELIESKRRFLESLPEGASVTGCFSTNHVEKKPHPNTAYGVREYNENYPVLIKQYEGEGDNNGRWTVQALNEGGFNSTSVDLLDILVWTINPHPELLEQAKMLTE